ncbi:MAG: nucleotide exchange factor GrpE [Rhizobiales bacterium]|nr:nucleotide exchange factor GrpE [Hyphomicrobiales bacterium]MBI3673964.1 nucleotide exchange factor GrpE [Hyphomicrobiales bacterium]
MTSEIIEPTEIESPIEAPPVDPRDVQIAALAEEVAAARDRMLRMAAEADNVRKRLERDRAEAVLYAATNFARDLLGVADNLGRALAAVSPEVRADALAANLLAGVELTERELLNVFQRHGIRKIETIGQKFDPNLHQALFEVPTNDQPPGTVVQEMQSGFAIGDRCLRPAMVGVAKAVE